MPGERFKLKFDSRHPHSGGGGGGEGGKGGGEAEYQLFTEKLVSLSPLFMSGGIPAGNFFQRRTDSIMWGCRLFSLTSFAYNTGPTRVNDS